MKKKILSIVEEYLRKHPGPSQIAAFGNLFKLSYTFSSPYTDSKQTKEVIIPAKTAAIPDYIYEPNSKKLLYNDKGRI